MRFSSCLPRQLTPATALIVAPLLSVSVVPRQGGLQATSTKETTKQDCGWASRAIPRGVF